MTYAFAHLLTPEQDPNPVQLGVFFTQKGVTYALELVCRELINAGIVSPTDICNGQTKSEYVALKTADGEAWRKGQYQVFRVSLTYNLKIATEAIS